jgi:SAM-dependent methyltransferase
MTDPAQPVIDDDAIAAHERIARFYKYRTPYGEKFFGKFAERAGLGADTRVLDLCCGTGAVAAGLAPWCKSVDAVDGAPTMIALAPAAAGVTYHLLDINSPAYADWVGGRAFDLVTIGMGINWLSDEVLEGLRSQLRPQGRVAILATGIAGNGRNPWFGEYLAVRKRVREREFRDWTGQARLAPMGYAKTDTVEQVYRAIVGVKYLIDNMLSFSSEAEKVTYGYTQLRAEMEERLAPWMRKGKLQCCWVASARLFEDQKSTARPL